MKFLRHLIEQPFIAATGFAALIHSTWALGTFFAGIEPPRWTIDWWGWLLPALLIAFSLDVGQISTSMKIRENGLNAGNALAFVVIALFTYFFQFLHLAHHIPLLPLGAGIPAMWRDDVEFMIGLAIWIAPALLPLSTLLYTFSPDKRKEQPPGPMLEEKNSEIESLSIELIPHAKFLAHCEDCGWEKECEDSEKAAKALNAHKSMHCKAKLEKVSQNGHVE